MPASVVNIGGSTSNNTWAAVRCPLYKGTGYRDVTLPVNKNWSRSAATGTSTTPFSSGYPEAVTPVLRAFPFLKTGSNSSFGRSTSMGLGVRFAYKQFPTETEPAILKFFLCVGEGETNLYSTTPYKITENVYVGYGDFGPAPSSGRVGYDINSTRGIMTDAVIVVKFKPGPDLSEETKTVLLDTTKIDKLFPDDVNGGQYNLTSGVSLGEYTWPLEPTEDWVQPYWSIESVTLA